MAKRTCINILSLLALIALSLSFTSCKKVSEKELVGLWETKETSVFSDGSERYYIAQIEFFEGGIYEGIGHYCEEDGTIIFTLNWKGEYKIKGKEIIYTDDEDDLVVMVADDYDIDAEELKKEIFSESGNDIEEIVSYTKAEKGSDEKDKLVLKDGDGEITTYYRE